MDVLDEPKNIDLDAFFNNSIQNPFTYNLQLEDNMDYAKAFERLKNIFIQGLLYITDKQNILIDGNQQLVQLDKVSNKDIDLVKQYMLSLGIELVHKEYTDEDKDYEIRRLLYTLQDKLKNDVQIEITMDWVKQLITNTRITCTNSKLKQLNNILRDYPDVNYILKIYSPDTIEDCHMRYNTETKTKNTQILHIISFRAANLTDYHYQHRKFNTQYTKHVR